MVFYQSTFDKGELSQSDSNKNKIPKQTKKQTKPKPTKNRQPTKKEQK